LQRKSVVSLNYILSIRNRRHEASIMGYAIERGFRSS
jgi:hypothetical protein